MRNAWLWFGIPVIVTTLFLGCAESVEQSGTFCSTGDMNEPRATHTATLLNDGKVLVVGGTGDGTNFAASAEVYDPATGEWTAVSSMSGPRGFHAAVLLNDGRVLVAGGKRTSDDILSSLELYDPSNDNGAD